MTERNIFYIDTGSMDPAVASAHVEKFIETYKEKKTMTLEEMNSLYQSNKAAANALRRELDKLHNENEDLVLKMKLLVQNEIDTKYPELPFKPYVGF